MMDVVPVGYLPKPPSVALYSMVGVIIEGLVIREIHGSIDTHVDARTPMAGP